MRAGLSRWTVCFVLLGLPTLVSLGGCGDDADDDGGEPVPVTKPDGGRDQTGGTGGGGDDAGGDEDDAGGFGDPVTGECRYNDPAPPEGSGEPEGTGVSLPSDLLVERVLTTWEGSCANPVLRIELSEGRCPYGTGHGVTLLIEANRILDGTIAAGQNVIGPDTNGKGVTLRYVRGRRDPPAGEWGNCDVTVAAPMDAGMTVGFDAGAGVQSGFLEFFGEPSVKAGAELVARMSFSKMPDCTTLMHDPADLIGTFRVTLERGIEDICP
jgi:hypothetical protein